MSLNTQVHKGSYRGVTPYEDYYKVPPNLDAIFVFRLGQFVTVTMVVDHIHKTRHDMRSSACIALHPEPASGGTWVWCPQTLKGFLRGNKDIEAVEYSEMPNQSKAQYHPTAQNRYTYYTNPTHPDPSIVKLIHRYAQMDNSASTTVSTIVPSIEKVDPPTVTKLPFPTVLTYQPPTAATTVAAIPSEKMQIDSPAMPTQPNDANSMPTADQIAHMHI